MKLSVSIHRSLWRILMKFVEKFNRRWTTRQKLLFMLYGSSIWESQRHSLYHQLSRRGVTNSRANYTNTSYSLEEKQTVADEHRASRLQSSGADHSSPDIVEELVGIPKLNRYARYYFQFSTCCHVFNVLLILLLKIQGEKKSKYSLACHVPRFVLLESIGQDCMMWLGLAFSVLHLIWRFSMVKYGPSFRFDVIFYILAPDHYIDRALSIDTSQPLQKSRRHKDLTFHENLIYFKVELPSKQLFEYRQRPNRAREYRQRLLDWVDFCFDTAVLIGAFSFVFLFPMGAMTVFFNHRYVYAGCENLDVALGEPVYYQRCIGCTVLSLIQFFDNFAALLLPTSLATIIVQDLLIYWRNILQHVRLLILALPNFKFLSDNVESRLEDCRTFRRFVSLSQRDLDQLIEDVKLVGACKRTVAGHVRELQAKLCDFFNQLDRANRFMSLLVTFALSVWLEANAVLTTIGVQTKQSTDLWLIRVIQLFGMIILSVISFYVLKLKKQTQSDYPNVNTIVAYDSSRNKKRWISILDYYSPARRFGFTYLNGKLYSALSFFKIVSYAFSFIVLFASVRDRY